eukprot:870253-Prorocentrum_minimum.AAC.1
MTSYYPPTDLVVGDEELVAGDGGGDEHLGHRRVRCLKLRARRVPLRPPGARQAGQVRAYVLPRVLVADEHLVEQLLLLPELCE